MSSKLIADKLKLLQGKNIILVRKTFKVPSALKMNPAIRAFLPAKIEERLFKLNKGIPFVPNLPRTIKTSSGRYPKAILYRNTRGVDVYEDAVALTPYDLVLMATFNIMKLSKYNKRKMWVNFFFLCGVIAFMYRFTWRSLQVADWVEVELELLREDAAVSIKNAEDYIKKAGMRK